MPVVTGLYVYPIKSCAGTSLETAELDDRGIRYDRHWVLSEPNGAMITQREHPKMALINPQITADGLQISAPGMSILRIPFDSAGSPMKVTVWRDVINGVDESEEPAAWFTRYLGLPLRLVRQADSDRRMVDPSRAVTPDDQTSLSDGYPILILSEESLADLNDHLIERGESPIPMNRFRPNIVVKGTTPFAEDTWSSFRVGSVTLHGVKLCARCAITTVDQRTADKGVEPLATLNTFRKIDGKVMFGQNVIHERSGSLTLHVGDPVEVL